MPYKFPAVIDGQTREVEVAEIPESVFTQEARTRKYVPSDAFESELSRRAEGIVKNKGYRLPDELVEDPTFVEKVSTKHGLKKSEVASADEAQRFAQRLDTERKQWDDKTLSPIKQENETLKQRNARLIDQGLQKEILRSAAAVGIKKQFLKTTPGGKPVAVSMFDGVFAYNPETDEYLVRDGKDAWAFSPKATKDKPYQTVEEYLEQWAGEKDNAEYVEPNRQSGPGLNRGGGSEGTTRSGEILLTQEQAADASVYADALKKVNGDFSKIRVVQSAGSSPFGSM